MNLVNKQNRIIQIENETVIRAIVPERAEYNYNEKAELALSEICGKALLHELLGLGFEEQYKKGLSLKDISTALDVEEKYFRLFNQCVRHLEEVGYINRINGRIIISEIILADVRAFQLDDAITNLILENKEYEHHAYLLSICIKSFRKILTGKAQVTDVMFPGGSLDYINNIYKGNYQADYFNNLLSGIILSSIKEATKILDKNEKIKILEVGAGTGGTSEAIFQLLKPFETKIEYYYTDVSRMFLIYGEQNYKAVAPYLKTAVFNIEESPTIQDLPLGEFDVIIGANVLHATKEITNALSNIKYLLKKNGVLILNEIAKTEFFCTLTFGLLEGWWLHEDDEIRLTGSPGVSAENWDILLTETGFLNTEIYPEQKNLSQQIIVAKSNGQVIITNVDKKEVVKDNVRQKKENLSYASLLEENVQKYLKEIFSKVLLIDIEKIQVDTSFESIGADSIMIGSLVKELSNDFGSIPLTIFFEYTNIRELACYFLENHATFFETQQETGTTPSEVDQRTYVQANADTYNHNNASESIYNLKPSTSNKYSEDIAIIGLSGKYPGANNINTLWNNLKSGLDSITEIPQKRWDILPYYNSGKDGLGNISSKYGGFIDGVEEFDPLFFNISPRDAQLIDPQERLFLQTVWETIEDAGYRTSQLSQKAALKEGVKTGVYVGVMYEEYQFFGSAISGREAPSVLGGSPSSIANRVSYFCDFNGPSMAIDTMCSSSLSAIHLACKDLRLGEINYAIAGGVNVSIHPNKYILLSQAAFLSPSGKCQSFGNGGDGFVPSEGVGAVLLKLLSKAEADGDHIYGVIKSTAVNHGGRTNGYTVPSPKAQASVIKEAIQLAGVRVEDFSYIEAHGTGTNLGDPIEIAGLIQAFKTDKKQFCSIGSIKSNIGHCESAAGISGITKVLLQLKHQLLAPSIHAVELNPNIDFANSPFKVQQRLEPWLTTDSKPRLAGVSSFGAGGSNAHIIIQEYQKPTCVPYRSFSPAIIVLSAKNEHRLKEQAANLLAFIKSVPDLNLYDVAYTLQTGREPMDERLAVITSGFEELSKRLNDFLNGNSEDAFTGNAKKDKPDFVLEGAAGRAYITEALRQKEVGSLCQLWIKGIYIDWELLYQDNKPTKIALPVYPFEKRWCWFKTLKQSLNDTAVIPSQQETEDNNAAKFYSYAANGASDSYAEDYLTFCPFEEIIPGFSMTRVFLNPKKYPDEAAFIKKKQKELRDVLFDKVDFKSIKKLFDIGCGHGTDIISFAKDNPQLHAEGFTITKAQMELANHRIHEQNLQQRAIVYLKDSAIDKIPEKCDVIIGIEVSFHIPDKHSLFHNISGALNEGGKLLLVDYISNLKGAIVDENIQISIPTESSWVSVLSNYYLEIEEIIDVSPQIANFLHDPEYQVHLTGSPKIARDTFSNYANQYISLNRGWISYCIIKLKKNTSLQQHELLKNNTEIIKSKTSYREALNQMKRGPDAVISLIKDASHGETMLLESYWNKEEPVLQVAPLFDQHIVMICGLPSIDINELKFFRARNTIQYFSNTITITESDAAETFRIISAWAFEQVQNLFKEKTTGNVLIQVVVPVDGIAELYQALGGLLRSVQLENPKFKGQLISVDAKIDNGSIFSILKKNSEAFSEKEIKYTNHERFVLREKFAGGVYSKLSEIPWKTKAVYLITGGLGELGYLFSRSIASYDLGNVIILIGRSPEEMLAADKKDKLAELKLTGASVHYFQVDVADRNAVENLISLIVKKFGKLNGIIHSAGLIRDNFIVNKTLDEWNKVIASKVDGVVNLDLSTSNMPLDFFVSFSSLSGRLGNIGQADYATANSFLDAFSRYRNEMVISGKRIGRTVSINWPLWKDGGMHIDDLMEKKLWQFYGISALSAEEGIESFYRILNEKLINVAVLKGDTAKIKEQIIQPTNGSLSNLHNKKPATEKLSVEAIEKKLSGILQSIFKLEEHDFVSLNSFTELGVDSVNVIELVEAINQTFSLELPTSILFSFGTIDLLASYIADMQPEIEKVTVQDNVPKKADLREESIIINDNLLPQVLPHRKNFETNQQKGQDDSNIAIIGLSCRCSGANNQDEFWDLIKNGKDCIKGIDDSEWLDFLEKNAVDKEKIKYGRIDSSQEFDASFFNISPKEAKLMDVTQRVLLEECYKALEDAGLAPSSLAGTSVGTFIGAMGTIPISNDLSHFSMLGNENSILAGRVAHFFNFKGPALTLNTACSSSLVAMDLAVAKLKGNEINLAVCGGITIYSHPSAFVSMNNAGMLSPTGECRPFDDGANGIVVGDGAGIIILKRLKDAKRDGDNIYGIIRGIGTNQNGRTLSITVPNHLAQSELLESVYRKNGIEVEQIQYIETHGTATRLGDPAEILGINNTIKKFTEKKHFCAIGSLKANIGHTTAAAGVLSVIKVLLSFKNEQMAPSIHFQKANEHIDFINSAVLVNIELKPWNQSVKGKRLAAVSSFGFSGTNAHMVLEDFVNIKVANTAIEKLSPSIIILSAKNGIRLKELAVNLKNYLEQNTNLDIADIAYTLQTGRDAMEERLAMLATDCMDLTNQLTGFIANHPGSYMTGNIKKDKLDFLTGEKSAKEYAAIAIRNNEIQTLAYIWTKGTPIDWSLLYISTSKPNKISLPQYPFAKDKYLLDKSNVSEISSSNSAIRLHTKSDETTERSPAEGMISLSAPSKVSWDVSEAEQIILPETKKKGIEIIEKENKILKTANNDLVKKAILLNSVDVIERLKDVFEEILHIPKKDIDEEVSFIDLGLDSISGIEILREINNIFGVTIQSVLLYDNPTMLQLAKMIIEESDKIKEKNLVTLNINEIEHTIPKNHLLKESKFVETEIPEIDLQPPPSFLPKLQSEFKYEISQDDIAIIAMDCLFPGANTKEELWSRVLSDKRLGFLKKSEEFEWHKIDEAVVNNNIKHRVKNVKEISSNYRQHELVFGLLDRLLETSGITRKQLNGSKTGVFIGIAQHLDNTGIKRSNDLASMIPAKISYDYNLNGPCEVLNSACTSTFLALHKAIQSIKFGDCEQAIVGGINIITEETAGYAGISDLVGLLSSDKEMKSFDDDADGIVRSEGLGLLIIKRLDLAKLDSNKIHALIKGTSFLHGGKNISWEAPNPRGIKEAIRKSFQRSGIDPQTVDYIEAHGIANKISDAIELGAINNIYKELCRLPDKKWFISSVKPTVGHPGIAAGMASIIKVVQALKNKTIPGISGLKIINKELDPSHSMILNQHSTYWKNGAYPRRASINSFAVGGTNAHIILQEFTELEPSFAIGENSKGKNKKTQDQVTYDFSGDEFSIIVTIFSRVFKMVLSEDLLELSFADMNITSIQVLEFLRMLNDKLNIRLTLGQVMVSENLRDFFKLVKKQMQFRQQHETISNNIINFCGQGLKFEYNTIIIPGMPGIVDGYYELANIFSKSSNVYGLQMQGIEKGTTALNSVEEMAIYNLRLIRDNFKDKPVQLIAHSYGGIVLYEMLKQWQDSDPAIKNIVLLDSYSNTFKIDTAERIYVFICEILNHFNVSQDHRVSSISKKIARNAKGKRCSLVYEFLKEEGVDNVDEDMFNRLWNVFEASLNIKYKFKEQMEIPVTLVRATGELLTGATHDLGWQQYYKKVRIIQSEGDHFTLVKEPHCSKWIVVLNEKNK